MQQLFSTQVTEDLDKDKDFYEGKDPYDENIKNVFAMTSLSEEAMAYKDNENMEEEGVQEGIGTQ